MLGGLGSSTWTSNCLASTTTDEVKDRGLGLVVWVENGICAFVYYYDLPLISKSHCYLAIQIVKTLAVEGY